MNKLDEVLSHAVKGLVKHKGDNIVDGLVMELKLIMNSR